MPSPRPSKRIIGTARFDDLTKSVDVPMEELRARPPEHEAVIGFLDRMEIIELKARVIKEWAELPTWIAVANMQREVNA